MKSPESPSVPLPPGDRVPDYAGGSLLNLMASIVRAHGGRTPHPDLRALPRTALRPFPKLVLLLLDGLGTNQLRAYLSRTPSSPFFGRRDFTPIDTVCPPTTAAAVTTVATGASPASHGIVGWHVHLADLGLDSTILPHRTRLGLPLAPDGYPLARYLRLPAPLRTTRSRRVLLSTRGIPTSPLSLAQPWWHERRAYATLPGLTRAVRAFARAPVPPPFERSFAYAYWPRYDSLCHEFGPAAPEPAAHLAELDALLARLAPVCAAHRTALLVTADHGLTPVARSLRLDRVPGFYDCLATLPSGDARHLHCFVRPHRLDAFRTLLAAPPLAGSCIVLPHDAYLASGLLGPGPRHPTLDARTGDFVLLAAPGVVFVAPPACTPVDFRPKGHHSGLSPDELSIPLYFLPPSP